jgi:hypothetical protein
MEINGISTNQLRIGVLGHLFEPPLLLGFFGTKVRAQAHGDRRRGDP